MQKWASTSSQLIVLVTCFLFIFSCGGSSQESSNSASSKAADSGFGESLELSTWETREDAWCGDEGDETRLDEIPLEAVLYILPPVEKQSEDCVESEASKGQGKCKELNNLDWSLLDFLSVSVCEITGEECLPVADFTSDVAGNDTDHLKIVGNKYLVHWKVNTGSITQAAELSSGQKSSENKNNEFQIKVSAAGLYLGFAEFTVHSPRTVPIKFSVENHPVIRAHILNEQGKSAAEVTWLLIEEFNLGGQAIAQLLADEGYEVLEIGQALADVVLLEPEETALILKNVCYMAEAVGLVLKDVYSVTAEAAVQILKDTGFEGGEIALALKDVFELDVETFALIFKDSGYTCAELVLFLKNVFDMKVAEARNILQGLQYSADDILAALKQHYKFSIAIVDVRVTDQVPIPSDILADYTGISFMDIPEWGGGDHYPVCTEPYIPNFTGQQESARDVNEGIGGTYTTLWVKYDLVSESSDTQVLTDLAVTPWSYDDSWVSGHLVCPFVYGEGWVPASGTSSGIQGALTTGTDSSCMRNGLCVKYEQMNTATSLITDVSFSNHDDPFEDIDCPALCEANDGYWAMNMDGLGIQSGCLDGTLLNLCYNRDNKPPSSMPLTVSVTNIEKLNNLKKYAPRIWLDEYEGFYPSSVDWAFLSGGLTRWKPCEFGGIDCFGEGINYRLNTTFEVCSDEHDFPLFWGNLDTAPAYAFWDQKKINLDTDQLCAAADTRCAEVVDLVYFYYFPYNHGKDFLGTTFGNHVGDWEHFTVRLMQTYDDLNGWTLQPKQVYLSTHSFGSTYAWDRFRKVEGTHPEIFSARGSHGFWPMAGEHLYDLTFKPLIDETSYGVAWDTWKEPFEAFDFDNKLGLITSVWPSWMSTAFTDSGTGDPFSPYAGAIYRWGNYPCGSVAGMARLDVGPTGPVSKGMWKSAVIN